MHNVDLKIIPILLHTWVVVMMSINWSNRSFEMMRDFILPLLLLSSWPIFDPISSILVFIHLSVIFLERLIINAWSICVPGTWYHGTVSIYSLIISIVSVVMYLWEQSSFLVVVDGLMIYSTICILDENQSSKGFLSLSILYCSHFLDMMMRTSLVHLSVGLTFLRINP